MQNEDENEEENKNEDSDIPFYKRPIFPDRELLLWEKWIKIRRDETTGLGERLQRPPVDLTMNLLANVREDKERKVVLEHAQIEKQTGVRGSLWIRPPRLKQRCYCAPAYEIQRTHAEKGRPKIVEHIGVPTYIRKTELGMAGEPLRETYPQLNADYKKYREKREDELIEKIKKIDPFRPDMNDLFVRGINPPTPPPKLPPLPEIIIEEAKNPIIEPLSDVYAIKINKNVFDSEIPGQNLDVLSSFGFQKKDSDKSCTFWTYYFNVPAKRAGRCELFLQNLGTVILRYCWKRIKRIVHFIPEEPYEQVFFFNKNEDVLSPGQSRVIYITFIADKPGIFAEYWELSVSNINFFDDMTTKLTVNLYADSIKEKTQIIRKVAGLKMKINRTAVRNIAFKILEEIIDKVFEVVPQFYPYKKFFVEAEIFVMKNPVCFYHQTEVNKMHDLYKEMEQGEEWDLSIGSWREKMMAKEFDDRMKYYELLRQSHAELLKPWYEGDGLAKEKHRTVKCLLSQFLDLFEKEFHSIMHTLMSTSPEVQQPKSGHLKELPKKSSSEIIDPFTEQMLRNVFYLRIYDHLAATIELCAGVLSSLDLNRWIEFDFCQR